MLLAWAGPFYGFQFAIEKRILLEKFVEHMKKLDPTAVEVSARCARLAGLTWSTTRRPHNTHRGTIITAPGSTLTDAGV